jgi:hypothetical protein
MSGLVPLDDLPDNLVPADDLPETPTAEAPGLPEAISRAFGRGGTVGLGDEFVGAARALGPTGGSGQDFANDAPIVEPVAGDTFAERYTAGRDEERTANKAAQEAHPKASLAANVAGGGALAAGLPAFLAAKGLGLGARMLSGAKAAAPVGAAYGFGESEADTLGGQALDTATGAAVGLGTGAALPVAGAAIRPGASRLAEWLRTVAGNRNLKAAGAIQSDITRARRQLGPGGANDGRAALQEVGAEMGEKGLVGPLSTPSKTFERAVELTEDAGGRMGEILKAADVAGGIRPSVQGVLKGGDEILARLQSNPHTAADVATEHLGMGHGGGHSAADMFAGLLSRYRRIYGDRPLSFSEAHQIRRNIDKDLYGLRGSKDPWADSYKEALHDFRVSVSNMIDASLDAATSSSSAWRAANRDYQVAAKALEFADKGMDRAVGNNFVSPTELLAGLTGAGIGSAHGSAGMTLGGLAAAGGLALTRRHGSGLMGSAALNSSNALRSVAGGVSPATQQAAEGSTLPALVEWLRARYGLAPAAAVAEEDAR